MVLGLCWFPDHDWMLSERVLVCPGQNYAQNHGNGFTLQIAMCRYSSHILAMLGLIVQIQMKKLTAAGKIHLSNVLQFHSVHYQVFFTVMNVRLLDCLSSLAPLFSRASWEENDVLDNGVIHIRIFTRVSQMLWQPPATALELITGCF